MRHLAGQVLHRLHSRLFITSQAETQVLSQWAATLGPALQSVVTPAVAQALHNKGYAVVDGLFPHPTTEAFRTEIVNLFQVKPTATSYVEKSNIHEAELTLDTATQQQAPLCSYLNQDRTLATLLSLFAPELGRLDAQAIKLQYNSGGGGCFPLHLDTDASLDGRLVTAIFYLNPRWRKEHAGLLSLYPWPAPPVHIEPRDNRLVLFSSARMLHRVTPSHTSPHSQGNEDNSRCCFTIWLSQQRGRRRSNTSQPSLSALEPTTTPEQDPLAAAHFLMQPLIRPHAMKLVYADEWETSLRESHASGPELDRMVEQHRAEVQLISSALKKYSDVICRLSKDAEFAAQAHKFLKWF